MSVDQPHPRRGCRRSRLDGHRPLLPDWWAFAGVGAVLLALFLVPPDRRLAFGFQYLDPTTVTAYTAHFVHRSPTHFAGNAMTYALLVSINHLLAVRSGRRRFFRVVFWTIILAFPFGLSVLNLVVPRNGVLLGFSGLNMALLGTLPVLLGAIVTTFDTPISRYASSLLFFGSLVVIPSLVLPLSALSVSVTVLAGITLVAVRVGGRIEVPSARHLWRAASTRAGDGELFLAGVVAFVAFLCVGFATDPATGAAVTNRYVHVLGYGAGYVVSFALHIRSDRIQPGDP
jgi:hypothetical protein